VGCARGCASQEWSALSRNKKGGLLRPPSSSQRDLLEVEHNTGRKPHVVVIRVAIGVQ
jgi:hypothetical protein